MKLVKLELESVKFATIYGNRDVDTKRLIKDIKKDGRVLVPILVIKYQDIRDMNIVLNDLVTGQHLENPSNDYYVIMDGQHRSKCALQLYAEMQMKGSDVKISDYILANVYEEEDVKEQNIMTLIMRINSSAKSWASKDYIKSAYTHNPEDEILSVVNLLKQIGFSISNISRNLFHNHKTLTPLVLSRYISGESELPEGNPRKALEILRMLIKKGFDINFLKKRYVAEEIIIKRNSDRLDEFLNAIYHLDSESVKKIEMLTPQDLDNHKIRDIIQEFEKQLNEEDREKCFEVDLSEKKFNDNIDMFKKIINELKARKTKKKTQKSKKNILNCTVDDVK